ncbi:MAG: hypothetical protein V1791_06795 [Pseudomonadota bacterium]
MDVKPIWLSKTLWVNAIAIAALVVQTYTGYVVDPENQVVALGFINALLRFVTKLPVTWSSPGSGGTPAGLGALALVVMLVFSGCATVETPQSLAAKSLLTTRQGVIAAATTVDGLCSQGVMKKADCNQAALIYKQAQAAYATTSDAFLLYLQLSDSASLQKFQDAQLTFQRLFLDIDGMAKAFQGGAP